MISSDLWGKNLWFCINRDWIAKTAIQGSRKTDWRASRTACSSVLLRLHRLSLTSSPGQTLQSGVIVRKCCNILELEIKSAIIKSLPKLGWRSGLAGLLFIFQRTQWSTPEGLHVHCCYQSSIHRVIRVDSINSLIKSPLLPNDFDSYFRDTLSSPASG